MENFQTLFERVENQLQTEQVALFLNGQCITHKSDFVLNITEHELHITVPKDTRHLKPLHIIHVIDTPFNAQHPLSTRLYGLNNSHATIFETYYLKGSIHPGTDPFSVTAHTDIYVSDTATLQHYLFCESETIDTLIHSVNIHQDKNTQYTGTVVQSSIGHQQTNITLNLNKPQATAHLHVLSLASETQMKSLTVSTHHHEKHCTSQTTARGIANGRGTSHFKGTIIVHPNASQTDAKLEIKQLLLSEQAEVQATPELEIYNDEVQCTHGATVGHLDEEALFYLKTRGIPEAEAKKMLINAFMQPILQHITFDTFTHIIQEAHGY